MGNYFLKVSEILRYVLFYKEMKIRNVYIGLLLDCILFVLLTFAIYYGDQSIEAVCLVGISSTGSWVGFLYFGWCNFWAEQSIVLFFFGVFEFLLGRYIYSLGVSTYEDLHIHIYRRLMKTLAAAEDFS